MNELKVFEFEEKEIRTVMIDDKPYFVGKDVAEILGYTNNRKALIDHVDAEDKGVTKCDTLGGVQELTVINESGLYSLILSSKLPKAKEFKRWVTSDVLPSIRKHGAYMTDDLLEKTLSNPDYMINLLLELKKERAQKEKLNLVLEEQKPKVEFYNAVAGSKDAVEMANVAKVLDIKGLGRNNLFQKLRDLKILQKNNIPYQEFIDRGYFRVIEQRYVNRLGETKVTFKTLVYQRGIEFIRRKVEK